MPQRQKNFLVALLAALITGVVLWTTADYPPYGPPGNELSNHSWGILIDIAHKWRNFSMSFWDRGVGGGTCLYSSGYYPILHPTNMLAWVLNDLQFFKWKVIEAYVFGVFFATWALLNTLRLRWPFAVFGGFLYMGLGFGRLATLADAPYFLWGCAIFPAYLLIFEKYVSRQWSKAAMAMGALLAFQFLIGGATQFPQVIIWCSLFWMIYFLSQTTLAWPQRLTRLVLAVSLFVVFAVGLSAVQFLPSFAYAFFESVRPNAGQYAINNFPLITPDPVAMKGALGAFAKTLLLNPGGVSWRPVIALCFLGLGLVIWHREIFQQLLRREKLLITLCVTTAIFFVLPTAAGVVAQWSSVLAKVLKPLSFFTFAYAVHIFDFCAMLCLCFLLDHADQQRASALKKRLVWALPLIGAAVLYVSLPFLMSSAPVAKAIMSFWPSSEVFVPSSVKSAGVIFLLGNCLILYFLPGQRPAWASLTVWGLLIVIGLMTMQLSFRWNDKGRQTSPAKYRLGTPEFEYFRGARGKFYLPFHPIVFVGNNFNLLYDIKGTSGFLQIPPKRFNQFMAAYHSRRYRSLRNWWLSKYRLQSPSWQITHRFPVDFTTIRKGWPLSWPGFSRVVEGRQYDVWQRDHPAQRVWFAYDLQIASFDQIVKYFDDLPRGRVMVTQADAKQVGVSAQILPRPQWDEPAYDAFTQTRDDVLEFETVSQSEVFVVVPEIYQKGWDVLVNGKKTGIFPADYLFIGFKVPAGKHAVTMRYTPPLLGVGALISAVFLLLFWGGVIKNDKISRRVLR